MAADTLPSTDLEFSHTCGQVIENSQMMLYQFLAATLARARTLQTLLHSEVPPASGQLLQEQANLGRLLEAALSELRTAEWELLQGPADEVGVEEQRSEHLSVSEKAAAGSCVATLSDVRRHLFIARQHLERLQNSLLENTGLQVQDGALCGFREAIAAAVDALRPLLSATSD
ncbi:MAG TPA: hypothetical protein EYH31_08800 [Anaerolineae bacterium]|nr:hypothetical protein [Anaerolineae bacterium]